MVDHCSDDVCVRLLLSGLCVQLVLVKAFAALLEVTSSSENVEHCIVSTSNIIRTSELKGVGA